MEPRRQKWWRPTFSSFRGSKQGKQQFHWSADEPNISECPVSAITPRSIELVQIVATLKIAHASTGSAMPAGELPGAILDAIRVCENESRSIESAMDDYLNANPT